MSVPCTLFHKTLGNLVLQAVAMTITTKEEEEEVVVVVEAYRVKGSSRVSASMSPLPQRHNECMPMNALVVL